MNFLKNSCHKLIAHYLFYAKPNIFEELTKTEMNTKQFLNLIEEKEPEKLTKAIQLLDNKYHKKVLNFCLKNHINIIEKSDPLYPKTFQFVEYPPSLLFVKGNKDLLTLPAFGIVGTRQASPYGIQVTQQFALGLANKLVIVSGLARGIDSIAHKTALKQEKKTIAVCALGLDSCYPKENSFLFNSIAKEGLLVSEYPLFGELQKFHFVKRNRLIAALSQGLLVTEAGHKSGALISAQYALDLGIDVFTIPGNIYSPQAKGSISLLKDGALCATHPSDILEHFSLLESNINLDINNQAIQTLSEHLSDDSKQVFKKLPFEPTPIDMLARLSNLPITNVLSAISELELESLVQIKNGYVHKTT